MSIKHYFHGRLTTSREAAQNFVTFDLPCDMQKGPSCRRTKPLPHCSSTQLMELLLPSLVPALSLKCSAEHIQGKEANLFAEAERQQQHSRPPPRYLPITATLGLLSGESDAMGHSTASLGNCTGAKKSECFNKMGDTNQDL